MKPSKWFTYLIIWYDIAIYLVKIMNSYCINECLVWSCSFSINSCKSESVKLSPEVTLKVTNGQTAVLIGQTPVTNINWNKLQYCAVLHSLATWKVFTNLRYIFSPSWQMGVQFVLSCGMQSKQWLWWKTGNQNTTEVLTTYWCQFHQRFYVQIFRTNIVSAAFSSYA